MAKLRVDKIASVGVSTETTGSVFFDGTGDFIKHEGPDVIWNANASDACTFECWLYVTDLSSARQIFHLGNKGDFSIQTDGQIRVHPDDSNWKDTNQSITVNTWNHIALVQESGRKDIYINGVKSAYTIGGGDPDGDNWSTEAGSSGNVFYIGDDGVHRDFFQGYISNVRVVRNVALYDENFIVPTKELEVIPETVLLCCHDGENIFAEKTGKIIAAYGDPLSSPTPTATTSPIGITTNNPGLTRDVDNTFGPTFQGGAAYASQNWLTLPKGTTTERNIGGNTRGLIGGGFTTPTQQTQIDLINIATTGNAVSFGDLASAANNASACSSSTRGLWAGGVPQRNTITFVTIATLGNSVNFGELDTDVAGAAAVSNSTRGIWGGGNINPGTPVVNNIQFVTIATQGSATAFGTLTEPRGAASAVQSTTRGVYLGGRDTGTPDHMNEIDYITISTTGDATDFGDLATSNRFGADGGVSSHVRGVVAGGEIPATTNLIEYITIASTGNSNDFGDLSVARKCVSGTSNKVRGTFSGGENPGQLNAIEYIIIQSMGNAIEFGDMTTRRTQTGSCSDGHGGLP